MCYLHCCGYSNNSAAQLVAQENALNAGDLNIRLWNMQSNILTKASSGQALRPLKQSAKLFLQSTECFTSGIVSRSLFCKHEPDYICATILVIHAKSIQGR